MNKLYERINSEKQVYVTRNVVNPEWSEAPADEWGVTSGSISLPNCPLIDTSIRVSQRGQVPEFYTTIKNSLPKVDPRDKAVVNEIYFIPTETPSEAGRLARDLNKSRIPL